MAKSELSAWETRLDMAREICGSNGITADDVDGIEYAVTVLLRIASGTSAVEDELADLHAMRAIAHKNRDKPAIAAARWASKAIAHLTRAETSAIGVTS